MRRVFKDDFLKIVLEPCFKDGFLKSSLNTCFQIWLKVFLKKNYGLILGMYLGGYKLSSLLAISSRYIINPWQLILHARRDAYSWVTNLHFGPLLSPNNKKSTWWCLCSCLLLLRNVITLWNCCYMILITDRK